jgi:hypothetical protein
MTFVSFVKHLFLLKEPWCSLLSIYNPGVRIKLSAGANSDAIFILFRNDDDDDDNETFHSTAVSYVISSLIDNE